MEQHSIHHVLSRCGVEVGEDGVGEGVAVDVGREVRETLGDGGSAVVPAEEALGRVVVDEGYVACCIEDARLHVGVFDRDAETRLQIQRAGSAFQPPLRWRDGLAAYLADVLDALAWIDASDAVETEGARGYHVVDVVADVERSLGVYDGRRKGFCEYRGMREAFVQFAGDKDFLEQVQRLDGFL